MKKDHKHYDVFISHASEDKDSFVRPLANMLQQAGLKVWYDEFSLRLGDSLSASIDKGIMDSRYGILILSPHFLNKNWTDYEYRSLLTRQTDGEKIILPLWYGVDKADVKRYSLYLTDIKGIVAHHGNMTEVISELLHVIRPDIWREMKMIAAIRKMVAEKETRMMNISDIIASPQKRSRLTPQQYIRSKAVFYGIGRHLNNTLQEYIDGYELDLIPERELQTWEIMNACYLEMLALHPEATEADKYNFYKVILSLSIGKTDCSYGLSDTLLKDLLILWLENYHND